MYGAALKNGAGGDGKQEYFCKVPYIELNLQLRSKYSKFCINHVFSVYYSSKFSM
jgi:hypothetical protein